MKVHVIAKYISLHLGLVKLLHDSVFFSFRFQRYSRSCGPTDDGASQRPERTA